MKKIFPALEYVNVPNLTTTVGLWFGIAAAYFLFEGDLRAALFCLGAALFMDLADGFLAGKLDRKTHFGAIMDSLVDFFVCCATPVWMVFIFLGNSLPLTIAIAFYAGCGLWRLAYYGVTSDNRNYFTGLPVPGGLLLISMTVWLYVHHNISQPACVAIFLLTGLLMISRLKMKKYGLFQMSLWLLGLVFLGFVIAT
ncbi:MAG: CDP-alcohol phosphatidyltransferase family protein [Oscillospiraceae bacterium]|nr:CDP-alcohol phosphatidyltransferase family protein [Oscillospiraceae bacterium]